MDFATLRSHARGGCHTWLVNAQVALPREDLTASSPTPPASSAEARAQGEWGTVTKGKTVIFREHHCQSAAFTHTRRHELLPGMRCVGGSLGGAAPAWHPLSCSSRARGLRTGALPTALTRASPQPLTSTGVSEICSPKEAQVASPCPKGLGVPEAQAGTEVVGVKRLLPVDRVVACGVVGAANPDLWARRTRMSWGLS